MRLLIVGAGIAGLTAAYFAKLQGFEVDVIDASPGERTTGYMMDFFGNGWGVAEKMNIVSQMQDYTYPLHRMGYVNAQGKTIFDVPIDRFKKAFKNRYTYIRRQDLEHILLEQAREKGVTIQYGTRLESLSQTADVVQVTLDDGLVQKYDMVIGADGAHSQVRTMAFGEESQFAHYLGYAVCAFETALDSQITRDSFFLYQEPNLQFGCYPISEHCMDVLYMIPAPKRHMHDGEIKTLLRSHVAGSGWVAESLLARTPDHQISYVDVLEQIRMPQWHQGRVVLVGDASACLTPIAGQGASMAMFESYTLLQMVAQHKDNLVEGLFAYEKLLQSDVAKRQQDAESFADSFLPTSRFGVWKQQMLIRAALSPLLIGQTARTFTGHLFAV